MTIGFNSTLSQQEKQASKFFDVAEVKRAYDLLVGPGQVVEVRALEALGPGDRLPYQKTYGGYFDNVTDLIAAIKLIQAAMGIYITLQPCELALLHRAKNKLIPQKKDFTTPDKYITRYRWLLIDLDTERPSGISATNEEHDQALQLAQKIREDLRGLGWPEPIFADSGNGAHLLYSIDLSVADKGLYKRVLEGMAVLFNTPDIHIDQTVFNPARICKLYGTRACKGDDTSERPHRLTKMLEVPEQLQIVTREQLEAIAASEQTVTYTSPIYDIRHRIREPFTAESFIQKYHIQVESSGPYEGGTRYNLKCCVWDPSHTDHSACIYQFPDGRLGASCSHNSCKGKGWKDLRRVFEPDAYTYKPIDETIYGGSDTTPTSDQAPPDLQFILDCFNVGEYGDARLFARLFRDKVLYDLTAQEWYKWAGHWWKQDEAGTVRHLVSGKLAGVYLKAGADLHEQTSQLKATAEQSQDEKQIEAAAQKEESTKKLIKGLQGRAFALRQISRCKNILAFAQSFEGMSINTTRWDRHTWLLAVPNGVLDLRTGTLRSGQPSEYIRTICPTLWQHIDTPAPRWEQFLQEIFADRSEEDRLSLISFLQRLFGYGITGEVIEHVFVVLYGEEGRNGKDTLQMAISHAMGAASGAISKDVLLDAGRQHSAGAATPHLSDLQGKRLAWASEPERGARFSIGQIKELSGGGEIPTRAPFEKKITKIQPTHLLLLLTNHKPHADATDAAFWDRLRLITFNMRFVDNPTNDYERQKDTTLWRALRDEAPGILAWLVCGCLEWQRIGLATPDHVLTSVQNYRKEEDTLAQFIEECCTQHPDAKVRSSELYTAYERWEVHAKDRMNKTVFGKQMSKRFTKDQKPTRTGIYYYGIRIIDSDIYEKEVETIHNYSQAASEASSQAFDTKKREGFVQNSSQTITPASEASLEGKKDGSVNSVNSFNIKSPIYRANEGQNIGVSVETIHTIHAGQNVQAVKLPVEPCQEGVNSSAKLFTDGQDWQTYLQTFQPGQWVRSTYFAAGQVKHVNAFGLDVDVMGRIEHFTGSQVLTMKLEARA